MRHSLFLPLMLCSSLLAACAAGPSALPQPEAAPASSPTFSNPSTELFYQVFLGTLALNRNDDAAAAASFARAAQLSKDPELARRATYIAFGINDNKLAAVSARRWLVLAPDAIEPRNFLVVLDVRAGDLDDAMRQAEAVAHTPGTGTAEQYSVLARLLIEQADRSRALELMQRIVNNHPGNADAHYAVALLALTLKRSDLVRAEATAAIKLRPGWSLPQVLISRVLISEGDIDAGLAPVAGDVNRHPMDVGLRLSYATLLLQAGKSDEAETEFKRVLKQNPDNVHALYAIGLLELGKHSYTRAEDYFERLLGTGERDDDAAYFLGIIAESRQKYTSALQWYREVQRGPEAIHAHLAVARMLSRLRSLDAAREYLDKIRAHHPDYSGELAAAEGGLLERMGRDKDARAIYDGELRDHPDDTDLLYSRALLEEKTGAYAAAEKDLRHILRLQPDNPEALNALGYTLTEHSNRYQEALGYIQRALQLAPDNPAIIDSLGWVEFRLGNLDRAVELLSHANEAIDDPEVAAHLGRALWAAGKADQARSVLATALKKHPDSGLLKRMLETLAQ